MADSTAGSAVEATGDATANASANPTEHFEIRPKEFCRHPEAVFAIGGSARLWRQNAKTDWAVTPNPLGVSIICASKKLRTPMIQRILYLQRTITKTLTGNRRKDPETTNRLHFLDVFEGEVKDEKVCDRIRHFEHASAGGVEI